MGSEGKRKTVRVSGGSNYFLLLNYQFAMFILIFSTYYTVRCKLNAVSSETLTRLCLLKMMQGRDCQKRYLFVALINIKVLWCKFSVFTDYTANLTGHHLW